MVERVSPQQFPDADGVGDWRVLADGDTAREVGGSVVKRTDESLGKITDVIKYGLVDPTVTSRYALADAAEAIAEVEDGHAAGKVIIVP